MLFFVCICESADLIMFTTRKLRLHCASRSIFYDLYVICLLFRLAMNPVPNVCIFWRYLLFFDACVVVLVFKWEVTKRR